MRCQKVGNDGTDSEVKRKGEAEAAWMLSWAFPVVTTVWGLQPVVWVVMVSSALTQLPKAQQQTAQVLGRAHIPATSAMGRSGLTSLWAWL